MSDFETWMNASMMMLGFLGFLAIAYSNGYWAGKAAGLRAKGGQS